MGLKEALQISEQRKSELDSMLIDLDFRLEKRSKVLVEISIREDLTNVEKTYASYLYGAICCSAGRFKDQNDAFKKILDGLHGFELHDGVDVLNTVVSVLIERLLPPDVASGYLMHISDQFASLSEIVKKGLIQKETEENES